MDNNFNNRRGRGRKGRGRGRNNNRTKRNITKTVGIGNIGRQNPLKFNFQAPSVETNMRYNDTFSINVAADNTVNQQFRLNSIFDPNFTGVGHNPLGYTQMATMYNRYVVSKVSVRIDIGSVPSTIFCVAAPSNSGFPALASFDDIAEFPFAMAGVVGANGGPNFIYNRTLALSNLTGVSKQKYLIDDRYSSLIGANPLEVILFGVYIYNPNGVGQIVQMNAHIEYYTIFSDPILPHNTTLLLNNTVKELHGYDPMERREKAKSEKRKIIIENLSLIHDDDANDDHVNETEN